MKKKFVKVARLMQLRGCGLWYQRFSPTLDIDYSIVGSVSIDLSSKLYSYSKSVLLNLPCDYYAQIGAYSMATNIRCTFTPFDKERD